MFDAHATIERAVQLFKAINNRHARTLTFAAAAQIAKRFYGRVLFARNNHGYIIYLYRQFAARYNKLMLTKQTLGVYKLAVAALVAVAVVVQFMHGIAVNPTFSTANFFSFFTIQSNILGALVFGLTGAWYLRGKDANKILLLRGAATLYMSVTGIVYVLLLSGLEQSLQTPIPWVNFTLHYLFPIIAFADWLIDRPTRAIRFKESLWWLAFPVMYLAYSLIRGPLVNWYPYPFLNPANGGYGAVAITVTTISLGALLLCFGFALLSRTRAKNLRKK